MTAATPSYGSLCLVLHAHLPYVRHPEHESFFEEMWLFEAVTECYLPLIQMLERLEADRLPVRLTLSLSPTLITMLRDPVLQGRYRAHLDKMCLLAEREMERTAADPRYHPLAMLYRDRLLQARETYETRYAHDLLAAFGGFQERGSLEIITSAATHGYLPLLRTEVQSVRAQLQVGQQVYQSTFGHPSPGVWLPECAYYEGLEKQVEDAGFGYFFLDSHGIERGRPHPVRGVAAPVACPNGIAAFGRDPESSRQVWSRDEGYPGDIWYRDFYRDIGFDLDFDEIRPFLLDSKTRIHTGFKYHRITGPGDQKEPYDPNIAQERVATHAEHFVTERRNQVVRLGPSDGPKPIMVAPYDAELFGHWWFEGPQWLESVLRLAAQGDGPVTLATPGDYLADNSQLQKAMPSASSWGDKGHNEFWLNPGNDWIYPHLHGAAQAMRDLVHRHGGADVGSPEYRALQQAARSLLLAQASDWAFIMKAGTSVDYALNRTRDHLARFQYLEKALDDGDIDERRLQALEFMDNIFPDIDPGLFA
ncbi:glycoside hydrolase family 57 protein [Magnetospira sp. QH-2]|uniref:glycoside hydrolase family 57 protein n=1 Tax=Magnetospira sp. (strain QH-2) TaxID=1288970 RepID=UPI0003E811A5|nr:1,4-alpha-glucan branching protein domain-containing protein [Magnetospira sp. QH-2]CCQ73906.1 GH57 : related to a-amylase [Magnetospira sp. QH-2]